MNSPPQSHYLKDAAVFFGSWLRSPGKTGAMWPSSRFLAQRLASVMTEAETTRVAELGPGTGPTTARIQQLLKGTGRHLAVDLNQDFTRMLAERFPNVDVVCDSATELPRILSEHDLQTVDAVISGLPFTSFPESLQVGVLDAVVESLEPGSGVFTTFNYAGAYSLPPAKRFRRLLSHRFGRIEVSRLELRNVPPAYVLTAREPLPPSDSRR